MKGIQKMATKKTAANTTPEINADAQAKSDILAGIVDKDSRTYTMQKTVSIAGERREGTFQFRYPTIADRLRQGVLQSKFLGGVPVASLDATTYNVAYAMAFLASVSIKLPNWFKYEEMESLDEMLDMYAEVNEFVDSFRRTNAADTDASDSKVTAGEAAVENR